MAAKQLTIIQRARLTRYTQQEFANLLGVCVSYASRIERLQRVPSLILAMKIATLLELSLDDMREWAAELERRATHG